MCVFADVRCNRSPQYLLSIGYDNKYVEGSINTKFPDVRIDNHMNWENHTEPKIPPLYETAYAVRSLFYSNSALSEQFIWSVFTL